MRIQNGFFLPGFFVFLLISWVFACSPDAGETSAFEESIRREVEQESFEGAMVAFNAGDYGRAKIIFEMLSESAHSPEISCQASFGLASIKFILAGSCDEYQDALLSWERWSNQVNSCKGREDPRMITPFLLRLQSSARSVDWSPHETKNRRAVKEADSRVVLQSKEKEAEALRSKLEAREREIRRLRQQIESLEEIHRKYQEKKQEGPQ
jgi:hypothetical protein